MKLVWAGLAVFAMTTAFASLAFNIVDFAMAPPSQGWRIFTPTETAIFNTILLGAVTLPAALVMVLAAAAMRWTGPVVGVLAILIVATAWGVSAYLDAALSPHETKRAQQWGAVWWYVGGLAYIVPAYLLTFFALRRTRVAAPLLQPAERAKSTGLP